MRAQSDRKAFWFRRSGDEPILHDLELVADSGGRPFEAMRRVLPDLAKLDRYEVRAGRRERALRQFE